MNRHGVVEVFLRRAHADCYSEPLQHLVGAFTDDMTADDLLFLAGRDQLHRRAPLVHAQRVVHADEIGHINLDVVAILLARLVLGQPDRADRRMAEDHRRDQLVLEVPPFHAAVQAIGQPATGSNGHGRQRISSRNVADRVDALDVGLLELVSGNETPLVLLDTGPGGVQRFRVGRAADCPYQAVHGAETAPVFRVQDDPVIGLLDRLRNDARDEVDVVAVHAVHEPFREHGFEIPQDAVLAHDELDARAQRFENARKLYRDIAAAGDQHALRPLLELEEVVRRDAVLRARDVGNHRTATCSDHDPVRLHLATVDVERVSVDEPGAATQIGHAALVEVPLVDAIEALDIGVASRLEARPVVTLDRYVEAVVRRMVEAMRMLCRIPHDLFRHASHVDAGAAQGAVFDHGGFRAVLGRTLGVGEAATAAADYEKIVAFGHRYSS